MKTKHIFIVLIILLFCSDKILAKERKTTIIGSGTLKDGREWVATAPEKIWITDKFDIQILIDGEVISKYTYTNGKGIWANPIKVEHVVLNSGEYFVQFYERYRQYEQEVAVIVDDLEGNRVFTERYLEDYPNITLQEEKFYNVYLFKLNNRYIYSIKQNDGQYSAWYAEKIEKRVFNDEPTVEYIKFTTYIFNDSTLNHYGILTKDGKWIVEPTEAKKLDYIISSTGRRYVQLQKNGYVSWIDMVSGQEVIPLSKCYKKIEKLHCNYNYYLVEIEEGKGLIDGDGKEVIKPSKEVNIYNGILRICLAQSLEQAKNGNFVYQRRISKNNYATICVYTPSGKKVLFGGDEIGDAKAKYVVFDEKEYMYLNDVNCEGDGRCNRLTDLNGEVLLWAPYTFHTKTFNNGTKYITYGLDNDKGGKIYNTDLSLVLETNNNVYILKMIDGKDAPKTYFSDGYSVWDESFHKLFSHSSDCKIKRSSIISSKNGSHFFIVERNGKKGLLNNKGREIVSPDMDVVEYAGGDRIRVKINGYYGLMSLKGDVLVPSSRFYTSIGNYVSSMGTFSFTTANGKGEIDVNGKQICFHEKEKPKPIASTQTKTNTSQQTSSQTTAQKVEKQESTASTQTQANTSQQSYSETTVREEEKPEPGLLYKGMYSKGGAYRNTGVSSEGFTVLASPFEIRIYENKLESSDSFIFGKYNGTTSNGVRMYKSVNNTTFCVTPSYDVYVIREYYAFGMAGWEHTDFVKAGSSYSGGGQYYQGGSYSSPSNSYNTNTNTSSSSSSTQKRWRNVTKTVICPSCNGTGECSTCYGKGYYSSPFGTGPVVCPSCDHGKCRKCGGTGTITKTEQVYE